MHIPPLSASDVAPLSFNQERELYRDLWARLRGFTPLTLNMTIRFKFDTPVNHAIVERALNEVVRRHDALRTGYTVMGPMLLWKFLGLVGLLALRFSAMRRLAVWTIRRWNRNPKPARFTVFRQWTIPTATVTLQRVDTRLPGVDPLRAVLSACHAPLDMADPPLIRAVLVTHSDGRENLTVVVSHLAFDLASEALFRNEFWTAYNAFAAGVEPSLPRPAVQYGAFAAWQRQRFSGPYLEECLRYWCDRLPGFSPFFSPVRVDELRYCTRNGDRRRLSRVREVVINGEPHARLRACCSRARVTPYMLLWAALGRVLRDASKRDPVVVWMAFANRTHPDLERLIGWVEQTLPLSLDFGGLTSDHEILERARAAVLGAMEFPMPPPLLSLHQGFEIPPGEELVNNHVGFDFRTEPGEAPRNESAARVLPGESYSDFALQISAFQGWTYLRLRVQYSLDWFADDGAKQLLDDLTGTLNRMTLSTVET